MANVYATKSGNWSDTTVWNTAALPTSADDVYSNTFTVNIDQDVTVLSLRNTTATSITAGGGFTCSTARTINVTSTGILAGSIGTACLTLTNTTGNTVTINGNCAGGTVANAHGVLFSGTGQVTINGNLSINSVNVFANALYASTLASTVYITGNMYSSDGNTSLTCNAQSLTIIGNITQASSGTNSSGVVLGAGVTSSITGSIISNGGSPAITYGASNIGTITGPVTGSTGTAVGASLNNTSTITCIGVLTARGGAAFSGQNAGVLTVSGPFICSTTGLMPISSYVKLTGATNNEFRFLKSTGGTTSLYSSDQNGGQPAAADVRYGTTYGTGGVLTGTLRVPAASSVAYGALVDNTTGTAAVKLQDVAAVVAAQIAAALST